MSRRWMGLEPLEAKVMLSLDGGQEQVLAQAVGAVPLHAAAAPTAETESNNTLALANALTLGEDPAGSGFFSVLGNGAITSGDVDYWKFTAQAGDRVSLAGEGGTSNNSIYLELRNGSDAILAEAGDTSGGRPQIGNFAVPAAGTYYVKARTYSNNQTLSSYKVRVDVARGFLSEAEGNNTVGAGNAVELTPVGGHAVGTVSGNIATATDVDYYRLGFARAGDVVGLATALPSSSALDAKVRLVRGSTGQTVAEGVGTVSFTLTADDLYYAQVSANTGTTAGIGASYLLNVDMADGGAPGVVGHSLPTPTVNRTVLAFDGANDYVLTPNLRAGFPGETVTMEVWFNPEAPGVIVSELGSTAVNNNWHDSQIEIVGQGEVRVRVWQLSSVSLGTAAFGEWHHVVLRYNRTTQTLDGFLDGVKSMAIATGDRSSPFESGNPLHYAIGATDGTNMGSGAWFRGKMDEVRIWNTARSDAEVLAGMNQRLAGNETGLVAYYRFDSNTGGTVPDQSGNGYHASLGGGTAANMPWWVTGAAPAFGATSTAKVAYAIHDFRVTFNEDLLPGAAGNPANYALREAGPNGVFGDGDDAVYGLTPTYGGLESRTVSFTVNPSPLQPGKYQFRTLGGLTDRAGQAVTPFVHEFFVLNPDGGKMENTNNDSIPGATPLPMVETPTGSGFFTSLGVGSWTSSSDNDYWRFDAEAGDRVTIRVEADTAAPRIYLRNASGTNLVNVNDDGRGAAEIQNYTITTPGTYYVQVYGTAAARYQLRLDQARGRQFETEANDTQAAANAMTLSATGGSLEGKMAGSLPGRDTSGDYYRLATLNTGNAISVTLVLPANASLSAADVVLSIERAGSSTVLASSATGTLNYTVDADGVYFVRVEGAANRGIRANYLLNVNITDGVAPRITSLTLPDEGVSSTTIIDRFTMGFSEDMDAATVNNVANLDLRSAGVDGLFGTADDQVYTLGNPGYTSGLSTVVSITDGPLQPGVYRLTASSGLKDRASNALSPAFVRNFTIENVSGWRVENRSNNNAVSATSLSFNPVNTSDGSFTIGSSWAVGTNPYAVVTGLLNQDAYLDLVVANYGSGNVSVLLGNGDGTFTAAVNYATGAGAISVKLADYNADGKLDLAVANYDANTLSVLLGNSDGTFAAAVNYPVGSKPHMVTAADFNADGKLDLVTTNSNSGTLSVLLGKGGGTFDAKVDYSTPSNPVGVVAADFNGDGKVDLATGNHGNNNVSILLGRGDGTFATAVNYGVSSNPRWLATADLNGDGKLDLVVPNYGSSNVGILLGNGDGTFGAATYFGTGGHYSHQVLISDYNADGKLDLAVSNYGNGTVGVLFGNGSGGFWGPVVYTISGQPMALAMGDFNRDGLTDLVSANYAGGNITMLSGRARQPLLEDPAGSGIRTGLGRGNLTSTSDYDYWTFYGNAGEILTLAAENPGYPSSSQLFFDILRPDGERLTYFYSDGNGRGQSSPVTLPVSGRYTFYVRYNNDYQGEYRVRATLVTPPKQAEAEDNNNLSQANTPTLTLQGTHQVATVVGYIAQHDTNGDYYSLGNLAYGTSVSLSLARPTTSALSVILQVLDSSNKVVAASNAGETTLSWAVPEGSGGTYYARVLGVSGTMGLMAQYILSIDLADTLAPFVTSVSLPAEGTTSSGIIDRVTVGFSEDMTAGTVNAPTNLDLRAAGADGKFGTADDVLYMLGNPGYAAGLTATYRIVDGPLQPGQYRLTVGAGLTDRAGNALSPVYMRTFTMEGVPGFVLESRNNGTAITATPLSVIPSTARDGSYTAAGSVSAGGNNPYGIASADLNGDGYLDVVSANDGSDTIGVLLGKGDGTFQTAVTYAVGDRPLSSLVLRDFNGDGKLDVAVSNYNSNSVSVLLGNGDGTFATQVAYATGARPHGVIAHDFNGDGKLDLATPNYDSDNITVLLGAGDGTFTAKGNYPAGDGALYLNATDLNGDGKLDLLVTNYLAGTLSVLPGNGDGSFGAATATYALQSRPFRSALADFNANGKLDVAVVNINSDSISILMGNGNGTFAAPVHMASGGNAPHDLIVIDHNGDGKLDLAVANNSNNLITLFQGRGDGTFAAAGNVSVGGNPTTLVSADYDNDGIADLISQNYNGHTISFLKGNRVKALSEDPVGSGIRSGFGRGNLSDREDYDYWSFTGNAGDIFYLAVEVPGNPSASGLYYNIYKPDGNRLDDFNSDYNGRGQSAVVTLPMSGTYTLYVRYNYDYWGEYRIRATTISGKQAETENNDSRGNADAPALTLAGGHQVATIAGYIGSYDTSGDYFRLGNLAYGTTITLSLSKPGSSPLQGILQIQDADGTVVATSNAGDASLSWAIPEGPAETYYARVLGASGTIGMLSQYILSIDLADTLAPFVTSLNLPAEGTTSTGIVDRFTVGFSEDMDAATVNSLANLDLRAAGVDGLFGTADDQVYALSDPGYTAGLSTQYIVTDGPLQPGVYRLTISTAMKDKVGNPMTSAYVRTFTVQGIDQFPLENRNNGWPGVTPLSPAPINAPDGSFSPWYSYGTGSNPYYIASGHFNGDSYLDVVTANWSGDNVSIFLGNGDGSFTAGSSYSVGDGAVTPVVGDFNGDGKRDIAVTARYSNRVAVLLGNGDGTFAAPVNYGVGGEPFGMASGDFNADGKLDLATANVTGDSISILLGNGDGTFAAGGTIGTADAPHAIAATDLDGDGKLDLVFASYTQHTLMVLRGNGNGTFAAATASYATGTNPLSIAVADYNGDGKLDVAVANKGSDNVSVFLGNGATLSQGVTYASGGDEPYDVKAMDVNGDGKMDLVAANYSSSHIGILRGNGDGTFAATTQYYLGGNPIAVVPGDYNNDGRIDFVSSNHGNSTIRFWAGNQVKPLIEDSAGTGMRMGFGRGNLTSRSDYDYWSFSGNAGETLSVAVEVPGSPGASGLYIDILKPDGSRLTDYYSDYNGRGQSSPVVLPVTGTYYFYVRYNYEYWGEYRVRATLTPAGLQWETEDNNNTNQADAPTFSLAPGQLGAKMVGHIAVDDTSGDYFFLGNLGVGTTINLSTLLPSTSTLVPKVQIYYGTTLLVDGDGNADDGAAAVTTTAIGAYYARIVAVSGAGLLGQYVMNITLGDNNAPTITSVGLPEEGATSAAIIDRFSLGFSEDLVAAVANDPANYELRSAGADGVFDTADDEVYSLGSYGYTRGLSMSYRITDGPLQPGVYRFTAKTALVDIVGNAMASPFVRTFTVAPVAGYQIEDRDNDTRATATELTLVEDPTGLRSAAGRGNLWSTSDRDYWSFTGKAGDVAYLAVDVPGNPGATQLYFDVYKPDGNRLLDFYPDYYGRGQSNPVTLPVDGTYYFYVRYNYDYQSEYRLRVSVASAPLQAEKEENNNISNATPLTLATSGETRFGSVTGYTNSTTDLDYFNLGTIAAGQTIFLTSRKPASSGIAPIVSIYDAANGYMIEAGSGRAFDGVAEVRINSTGTYYAVIRTGNSAAGLLDQYVLDVQVLPTGSVTFPNLQVTNIELPAGAIQSGQNIPLVFTVKNVGSLPTAVGGWSDRAVLSLDDILGNADDIPLGVFAHSGVLDVNQSYTVTRTVRLPDGISGDYRIIVETDTANAVNEFLLEGDNITATEGTFHVSVAPYADLRVEDVSVSGPDASGNYSIAWKSANRGTLAASAWRQRIVITNLNTNAVVLDSEQDVAGPLDVNGVLAHLAGVKPMTPGRYRIVITTDSQDQIFEYDGVSHSSAEQNNTVESYFDVFADLQVGGLTVTPSADLQTGQTVTISWNDVNNGVLATSGSFTDRIIIRNRVSGEILASQNLTYSGGPIAPGASVPRTINLRIPDGPAAAGELDFQVTTDYSTNIAEYNATGDAESNNTSLATHAVALAPYPDLQINNASVTPPTGLQSGGTFTITWTDRNSGNRATSGGWYDRIVIVNTTTGQTLRNDTVYYNPATAGNGDIAAGDSRQRQYVWTLPDGSAGVGAISVTITADTHNNLFEHNATSTAESNNTANLNFSSTLAPYPDLQVTGVAVEPTTFQSGSAITIRWNDVNAGQRATSGSWYDRVTIYNVTTGQTILDTVVPYNESATGNGPIAAGASRARSHAFTLPDGPAGAGQLRITVTSDTYNAIFEDNANTGLENNNQATINVTSTLAPYPDLTVTDLTVDAPAGLQSGATATLRWNVRNSGTADVTRSWYDYVVIRNGVGGPIIGSGTVYHDTGALGNLAAGAARARQFTFTLPQGPSGAGNLVFEVITDYYNQVFEHNASNNAENNNAANITRSSALAPYPDLTVSGLNVIAPSGLRSGEALTLTWNVSNTGNTAASQKFYDRVTIRNLTTNQVLASTDLMYDPAAAGNAPIEAGASRARQFSFTLPNGAAGAGNLSFEVTTDVYNHLFEHNAASTGETNNTASIQRTSTLASYPDLTITNITAPANALPGQQVTISWTIKNIGDGAVSGTWSEQVYLSSDSTVGGDQYLGSFSYTGSLAPNATATRSETISLPMFDAGNRWFVIRVDAGNVVFEHNEANNAVADDQPMNLPAALTLSVNRTNFAENAGASAAWATLSRNNSVGALVVSLANSNPAAISVPATITIPDSQSSISFYVGAVDDLMVDGTQTATLAATAAGFTSSQASFEVTDNDVPSLFVTIQADSFSETAGTAAATAIVRRNTGTEGDLVIALSSDTLSKLSVPRNVTIPAGQDSVSFTINAVNNDVIDGDRTVTVRASAINFASGTDTVIVTDDDIPTLTLTLSAPSISEGTPAPAMMATVTRSIVTPADLYVTLRSSDTSAAYVPAVVRIPGSQASVSFPINATDDGLVDGTQSAVITALVTTNSGVVLTPGQASATVDVLDNDGPSLSIRIANLIISETGSTTGYVTRNTPAVGDLLVNLLSLDTTEATVPATVVIPNGQTTASFTIRGVSDGVVDGLQPIAVRASANEFASGTGALNVSDIDLPDLRVSSVVPVPTMGLTGQSFDVTWTVSNDGIAPANGSWVDRVYLSSDNRYDGSDTQLTSVAASGPLAIGQSYSRTRTFTMPSDVGSYYVIVVTDSTNFVTEGSDDNNSRASDSRVVVSPAYSVTATTSVDIAPNGSPIPITGKALAAGTNLPVANAPVSIYVIVNGTQRLISATTNANGEYSATFRPLPYEAGRYTLAADHPGVRHTPGDHAAQDTFTIVGMRASPTNFPLSLTPGIPLTGEVELRNLSDVPLTNLTASVLGAPANLQATLEISQTLEGSGTVKLHYTLNAIDASLTHGQIAFHITTAEGATLDVPVSISIVPLVPTLKANPGFLQSGMLRGTRTLVSFDITNIGGAPTDRLNLVLPDVPWMSAVSSTIIESLEPGQSTRITLALTPAADLTLQRYDGTLRVQNDKVSLPVTFQFRAISDAVGDVEVAVTDDYTYNAAGAPKVEDADVTLRDVFDNSIVVAHAVTDTSGVVRFTGVREGNYVLEVRAAKHTTYRATYRVAAGITNETEVFLKRETITYSWVVVPTEIQDRYIVHLESTFETNVPVPVVTMEAPDELPPMNVGDVFQLDVTFTNQGLIQAESLQLRLPTHADFEFTALTTDLGPLPAKSTITVPITVRRKNNTNSPPCSVWIGAIYSYLAKERVYVPIQEMVRLGIPCGNPQTVIDSFTAYNTGWGSGGWGGGGGTGGNGEGTIYTTNPTIEAPYVDAKVRIRIDQEAVITRAAFLGTLEIDNGSTEFSLRGIRVDLDIKDEHGNVVTDRFAIRGPELSGLTGVDGEGIIAPDASGSARYTFIPNREAAPEGPTVYHIGGTLRYLDPETGLEVTNPLQPATITVYPDPILHLNYFQQRDVIGDDPFTDPVEPSEPFVLGLLVTNTGKGAAKNFTITSAQPKIIENEKGLLIDFKIIGTQVGNQLISPSLTANLGSIDPGQTRVAQWLLTSTLQGRFIDYSATFEHIDGLGDARLSLIDSVTIHELIHAVRANRPGDDNLPDFLVNDEPDPQVLPDRLYLSDGSVAVVNVASNATVDGPVTASDRVVTLTANMTSGWNYVRLPDPGGAYRLSRVVRSDGVEVSIGDNAWQTHRVFSESDSSYTSENRLHILDFNGTGSYTLYYTINDTVAPSVTAIATVTPNPQTGPVAFIDVTFSEQIDLTTFDFNDVAMVRDGSGNLINNQVSVTHLSGNTYRIANLAGLTADDGNYVLTVNAAGITDFGGNAGTNSLSTTWAKGTGVPVVVSVGPVNPDPRNIGVVELDIVFSKPIDPTSVSLADIQLTRNGSVWMSDDALGIVRISDKVYRVIGIELLTSGEGVYVLTVNAAGVKDVDGNAGVGSKADTWVVDTTAPQVAGIEHLATNPRNIVVPSLEVTFSEAINPTTFDWRDITLTRNGGANLITDDVVVTRLSDTVYRISNFNWVVGQEGTYVLTVSGSGIQDRAGNTGTGSASETWVMDTTRPPQPFNFTITPDTGVSSTDGLTNATTFTVTGQLGEAGLTVRFQDMTTDTDLLYATVNGLSFTKTLTLTPGAHRLMIRAVDAASNTSWPDTFFEIFIDVAAPAAVLTPIAPDPATSAVPYADVIFSEAINPATFTWQDISLTRDGGANLITSAVTITHVSGNTYRIGNLTGLTNHDGDYVLSINMAGVEDRAGNVGTIAAADAFRVALGNESPVVNAGPDLVANEGAAINGNGSFTDPNAGDTWTATINYGDGTATENLLLNPDKTFDLSHVYADNGTYTITVTVMDRAGVSATDTVLVTVNNVAPTATFSSSGSVNEGTNGTVSFTNVADVSSADVTAGFRYSYDFDNNGTFDFVNLTSPTATVPSSYLADGPLNRVIRGRIIDKNGGFTDYLTTITVNNVPPTVNAGSDFTVSLGATLTATGSYTDPGVDTFYATVNYGDGSGDLPLTLKPDRTFTLSRLYAAAGQYTVSVTVTDSDGASHTDSMIVTVLNMNALVANTAFYLRLAADGSFQFYRNAPLSGAPTFTIPAGQLNAFSVRGSAGNDSLTLDLTNGNPLPVNGTFFDGLAGFDTLTVIGRSGAVGSYTPDASAADKGSLVIAGRNVQFAGLEPVVVSNFASFTFTTPRGADTLLIDSPAAGQNRISGTSGGSGFESLTFSGVGQLTLDAAANDVAGAANDAITIASAGLVASGLSNLILNTGTGTNSITVQGGAATLQASGSNLSFTVGAAANVSLTASLTVDAIEIRESARVSLAPGGSKVLRTGAFSLADSATLDLNDNDLVLRSGSLSQIESLVKKGYNNGQWTGTGITSSAAKTSRFTTLGVALNNQGGKKLWADEDLAAILVKYTYYGDVNLDGQVNLNDYFTIDSGYLNKRSGFVNGDMNFDGEINLNDYFLIDSAYLNQTGTLAGNTLHAMPAATTPTTPVRQTKLAKASVFSSKKIVAKKVKLAAAKKGRK